MDKEHELAGRVDELLGRHGRVSENADDRNVPLLTDLVGAPDWAPATLVKPHNADPSALLKQLSEHEIDTLSNEIFTRVLDRLDHALAGKLEERLTAQLAPQINSAINHVITDLRQDIANEIGDAVNAALADRLRQS
ncbi:MAG: hypothetical protein ABL931_08430 [Usitatibacteraceae bacterium]